MYWFTWPLIPLTISQEKNKILGNVCVMLLLQSLCQSMLCPWVPIFRILFLFCRALINTSQCAKWQDALYFRKEILITMYPESTYKHSVSKQNVILKINHSVTYTIFQDKTWHNHWSPVSLENPVGKWHGSRNNNLFACCRGLKPLISE